MLHANYPGRIPDEDLVGRIMGPDTRGGFTVVTAAEYQPDVDKTRATLRPITKAAAATAELDAFGQPWLPGVRP